MLQDLRYGARMLTKNSGFTLIAVLSLALGIGLTTAIFSLAYSILLRALPYPNAERLVALSNNSSHPAAAGLTRLGASSADWMDWREQSKLFEDIALTRTVANFNLTGGSGCKEHVPRGICRRFSVCTLCLAACLQRRRLVETPNSQS